MLVDPEDEGDIVAAGFARHPFADDRTSARSRPVSM